MRTGIVFLLFLLPGLLSGCTTHNKLKQEHTQKDQAAASGTDVPGASSASVSVPADEPVQAPSFIPGPPALVYKTKGDYHNLVPVILSADKKTIVSYPHPQDLVAGGKYTTPVALHEGYLLDNRGIGVGVAFLKMDYKTYASLEEPPPLQELYDLILDKDPLTILCDCGSRTTFDDPEKQLNRLIDQGRLETDCRKLK